jgi:NADH:ubiquinone oxidoreductase subunit 5 (subunit L)/multisubunit Na+/H+ antiporter MnhA subunit
MARKNDKTAETALLLGSIAIFCVFLINSFIVFKHFSKKYNLTEADERVTDSLNIMTFIPKILLILGIPLLFYIFGAMIGDKLNNKNVFYIFIAIGCILGIIWAILLSARVGTTQIGVLIYKKRGIAVIPYDSSSNNLTENLLCKYITGYFLMEEIPLAGITKITRESGKKLFIHGTFGTRCIAWRNKQKRDECIAALELACKKRLSSFDIGE